MQVLFIKIFLGIIFFIASFDMAFAYEINIYKERSILKDYFGSERDSTARQVRVDEVTIGRADLTCVMILRPSLERPLQQIIRDAFNSELRSSGAFDADFPTVRLRFEFEEISISVPFFGIPGRWKMNGTLVSSNGSKVVFNVNHDINRFSIQAGDGCNSVGSAFPDALASLFAQILKDASFGELFLTTTSDRKKREELVAQAAVEEAERVRLIADAERLAAAARAQAIAMRQEAARAERARQSEIVRPFLERLVEVETKARVKCFGKEDCDRKYALAQVFVSTYSRMKQPPRSLRLLPPWTRTGHRVAFGELQSLRAAGWH